MFTLTIVDLEY